jgi:hypothetical protein
VAVFNFKRGGVLVVLLSTIMVPWKVIETQQNTAVHSLFAVRRPPFASLPPYITCLLRVCIVCGVNLNLNLNLT